MGILQEMFTLSNTDTLPDLITYLKKLMDNPRDAVAANLLKGFDSATTGTVDSKQVLQMVGNLTSRSDDPAT